MPKANTTAEYSVEDGCVVIRLPQGPAARAVGRMLSMTADCIEDGRISTGTGNPEAAAHQVRVMAARILDRA